MHLTPYFRLIPHASPIEGPRLQVVRAHNLHITTNGYLSHIRHNTVFLSSLPVDGILLPVIKASKSRIKFVQKDTSALIFFNPLFETLPVDRTELYSQLAREVLRLNSLFALITVTTLHSLDPPLDTTQKAWCFNHFGNTRTYSLDGYLKAKVHTLLVWRKQKTSVFFLNQIN